MLASSHIQLQRTTMSKKVSEFMSNDKEIVEPESDMNQISTNSIEAARKLSAIMSGKSNKCIRERTSFEPEEDIKRQR